MSPYMDALEGRLSSAASSSASASTVAFDISTVQELTDVCSAALFELPAGQPLLSNGRFCHQFQVVVSMVLFLRAAAHALAGLDPLNPQTSELPVPPRPTLGQLDRLIDQCVAMSGLCVAELQELVQGLSSADGSDTPALVALKAHIEACVSRGFLTVSPLLAERAASNLLGADLGGVVPGWPVDDWSVCGVCGVHVHAHETHRHASNRDTYDASECARLGHELGKGKKPVNILSGEVATLRQRRLEARRVALILAAGSPVVPETGLAAQVQQLHEQIAAMSTEMQQIRAACGAAEQKAAAFERAYMSSEARVADLQSRFNAVCQLQHQVASVMGVSHPTAPPTLHDVQKTFHC